MIMCGAGIGWYSQRVPERGWKAWPEPYRWDHPVPDAENLRGCARHRTLNTRLLAFHAVRALRLRTRRVLAGHARTR